MQRDGLDEECLRDSSPRICKQLLFASSMPVTIKNQELLQKAVRVALSVDDKDPAFLCRLKLVVTSPATQCHRLFGGVLKDCRHDADSTTAKILSLVDQLAMKRQGRRDASGIAGLNDQIDEELKHKIRKIFLLLLGWSKSYGACDPKTENWWTLAELEVSIP